MWDSLKNKFRKEIGIDLGTANTLLYVKGRGIVINEPSVVAVNTRTEQILAVGNEAKDMLGKTPPHIITTRPLTNGIISDFEVTEKMLRYFIGKISGEGLNFLSRPRVVIGAPLDITEVEKKAIGDAIKNAGAREVWIVEEPMAAAIGTRMPVKEPVGNFIVKSAAALLKLPLSLWAALLLGNQSKLPATNSITISYNTPATLSICF